MDRDQILGLGLVGAAVYFYLNPRAFQQLQDTAGGIYNEAVFGAQDAMARQRQAIEDERKRAALSGSFEAAHGIATGNPDEIAGGVLQLAQGIVNWARGGYEGVTGNELRDRFLDQFVQVYFPGAGVEQQYEAMVRALAEIGIVGGAASAMIDKMYGIAPGFGFGNPSAAQDTVEIWARAFAAKGVQLQLPTRY